jgi:hypothetical protein
MEYVGLGNYPVYIIREGREREREGERESETIFI